MTTCSRSDCTKKLRSNNTTGHCATGCLSDEAPPSSRAKATAPKPEARGSLTAMERLRDVAQVLNLDPDAVLEEFAQAWLEELRGKLG